MTLLLLGAVEHQRGPEHRDSRAPDDRGSGGRQLLLVDQLLERGEAGPTVLARPVGRGPAALGEGGCPLSRGGARVLPAEHDVVLPVLVVDAFTARKRPAPPVVRRKPLLDERSHARTELRLLWRVRPIHRHLPISRFGTSQQF